MTKEMLMKKTLNDYAIADRKALDASLMAWVKRACPYRWFVSDGSQAELSTILSDVVRMVRCGDVAIIITIIDL